MRSLGKQEQLSEYWGAVPPARRSTARHCQMNKILSQKSTKSAKPNQPEHEHSYLTHTDHTRLHTSALRGRWHHHGSHHRSNAGGGRVRGRQLGRPHSRAEHALRSPEHSRNSPLLEQK